jgi:hypothetical protein
LRTEYDLSGPKNSILLNRKLFPATLLATVLTVLFLNSCKKDDDSPATRAGMLVGTWKTTEVGVDSNANGMWDLSEHRPAAGSAEDVKITFNNDGSGSATYTVLGSPFPITWNLQNNDEDLRLISSVLGPDTTIVNIVSFSSTEAIVRDKSETPVSYMTLKKQ